MDNVPFVRMTANRWALTPEARRLLTTLLVYMRNEFRVGVSAAEYHPPDKQCEAVWGAALNFRNMMQCIDRMLARVDGTFDATKLSQALSMAETALAVAGKGHIARHVTNSVERIHGTLAPDSIWYRSDDARNDKLPSATGAKAAGPVNGSRGNGPRDDADEHVGPGGYIADSTDRQSTGTSDPHGQYPD